ncbi:fasciclin-2-like isoform X4 [Crassostrea virginica]
MIIRSSLTNKWGLWTILMGLVVVGTEGQDGIVIEADNPLIVEGLKSTRIQCKNTAGTSQDANLQWYGPNGNLFSSSSTDPIYTYVLEVNSLSLIFTTVQENDAGTYFCNGTINGTPRSASIVVNVDMPLIVTEEMAPRSQTVKQGTTGFVKCTGPGGYTVAWRRNGQPVTQDSNGTDGLDVEAHPRYAQVQGGLEISNVNASVDEGVFVCNVYKTGSIKLEFINIQVTVTVPPVITSPPSVGQAVVGQEYRFECQASGKPAPEYLWFKGTSSNELTGDRFEIDKSTGILIIKEVVKDDEAVYKCEARNEADKAVASAELTVIIPPKILEYNNGSGEEGSDAILNCKAHGDPIPTIKWFKGSHALSDASPTQDVNEKTVVSKLSITDLSKDDGGQYTCEAATQNAPSDKKNIYLVVKYKPAFDPGMASTAWTWKDSPGKLICLVQGEPRPTVEWYEAPDENGNRPPITEGSFFTISNKEKDANTIMSTLNVVYDFTTPLGEYLCKATNDLGSSNRTIRLRKADPPSAPAVTDIEVTPNTADFSVRFSSVSNAPPPTRLQVKITNGGSVDTKYFDVGLVNGNPKELIVGLVGLIPSTSYTFEFIGESAAGEGAPRSVPRNTPAPRKPYKVEITNSRRDGEYPNKFILEWETPKNGGAEIKFISICRRRVRVREELSPTNEYQFVEQVEGFICEDIRPGQSTYELTNLEPTTYYQVNVRANNDHGLSEDSMYIFKTKSDKPIQTTVASIKGTKADKQSSGEEEGLPVGVIIAILIIVFIILFVVVDLALYYKKKCGVIMCLKQRCGGSNAGAGGGGKDAEKGGDDKPPKTEKESEKEENTKPLLKTEEEEKNGKEEELKEMEPEEKEKASEKSPTIENAEEAKPAAPESPQKETAQETKPEEKTPTSESKPEAPATEGKGEK